VLKRDGVLLLHDARRPSLTALVAGTPIWGSWWGHPAGGEIFRAASALEEGGEALFVPLLGGKVTLVHPALWADLAAVGEERAEWQISGLHRAARALLAEVEEAGRLRASGPPAKALARVLLVHAAQVHTERGAHATELQTWSTFRRQHRLGRRGAAAAGRRVLEGAVARALGRAELDLLPWREER
jgi:hypothetical protein